jgi:hypothetical protein
MDLPKPEIYFNSKLKVPQKLSEKFPTLSKKVTANTEAK